ncbi:MAG: acyltransferase [Clostridiales bacterium]|nr:acyltransferase [Clostridiales bacterium]
MISRRNFEAEEAESVVSDSHYRGYIDSLKGMAVVAIILYHISVFNDPELPWPFWWITHSGDRGVQLFFVISGFLSYLSLDRRFKDPGKVTSSGAFSWIKGRLIKLVPLYYLALVMSMLTHSWSYEWLGNEGHVTVTNFLSHIVLVHGLFPHYSDSILWVEWYLGVLILYLLFTPLVYKYVNTIRRMLVLILVFAAVIYFIPSLLMDIMPVNEDPFVYYGYIYNFSPHLHLIVYSLGILLGMIARTGIRDIKKPRLISGAMLVFLVAEMVVLSIAGVKNIQIFGLWSFLLVLSQEIHAFPVIDNWVFRFIGKHSYVMYLFQFIFFNIYDQFIGIGGLAGWCLKGIICIVMLLCFSCAISMIKTKFKNKVISR